MSDIETIPTPGALVAYDYGEDEGAGYEHQDGSDITIPFMVLLQALSPQVKDRVHPLAVPGSMYNTVTEKYYSADQGFLFVPATTRHLYCRWVPRDEGGGFRGHHDPDEQLVIDAKKASTKFGKFLTPDPENPKKEHQLVETRYVYGALCDEDGGADDMVLLAFTSTKITAYKKWMKRLRGISFPRPGGGPPVHPPLYSNLTRVVGMPADNAKGDFFVFGMRPGDQRGLMESLLPATDPRFMMAKACKELVDTGKAKVDFEKQGTPEKTEVPF
jgi:hypothetical protein